MLIWINYGIILLNIMLVLFLIILTLNIVIKIYNIYYNYFYHILFLQYKKWIYYMHILEKFILM